MWPNPSAANVSNTGYAPPGLSSLDLPSNQQQVRLIRPYAYPYQSTSSTALSLAGDYNMYSPSAQCSLQSQVGTQMLTNSSYSQTALSPFLTVQTSTNHSMGAVHVGGFSNNYFAVNAVTGTTGHNPTTMSPPGVTGQMMSFRNEDNNARQLQAMPYQMNQAPVTSLHLQNIESSNDGRILHGRFNGLRHDSFTTVTTSGNIDSNQQRFSQGSNFSNTISEDSYDEKSNLHIKRTSSMSSDNSNAGCNNEKSPATTQRRVRELFPRSRETDDLFPASGKELFPHRPSKSGGLFPSSRDDDDDEELFTEDQLADICNGPTSLLSADLFPEMSINRRRVASQSTNAEEPAAKRTCSVDSASFISTGTKNGNCAVSRQSSHPSASAPTTPSDCAAKMVVVASVGTSCDGAQFKIFKCDFCRVTFDTSAAMDVHLLSSKHLSASEFGARATLSGGVELIYIERTLAVRNCAIRNKLSVVACPECRDVFDDVFTCALHNKYEHCTSVTKPATTSTSSSNVVSSGSGFYSICPVISCEMITIPGDDSSICSECNVKFESRPALCDHWSENETHQPAASRCDNPQVFLLAICPFCQRMFRDRFIDCIHHVAGHFSSSDDKSRRRVLTIEVKQVVLPFRKQELPQFNTAVNSYGMKDELLMLQRLRDCGNLSIANLKTVNARLSQLQKMMAQR